MATASSTILILTSNTTLGTTLQKRLHEYGHRVVITSNEHAALDESLRHLPLMILVERAEMHKNPRAMLNTLRRNAALKQVPVVTFTDPQLGCCEEECATDVDCGFDGYLCNMTSRQIVAYARAILRSVHHSKAPRDVLEVGQLRMDLARHEVRVGGRLVQLTLREFRIMKEFMLRPSVVLRRQELLNRIWGEECAMEEHALDVHIHALRQKIEHDPAKPVIIVTIRGVGYKLQTGAQNGLLLRAS